MKYLTIYYDDQAPGAPWDSALELAKSGMPPEDRGKTQFLCLPERWKQKEKNLAERTTSRKDNSQRERRNLLPMSMKRERKGSPMGCP